MTVLSRFVTSTSFCSLSPTLTLTRATSPLIVPVETGGKPGDCSSFPPARFRVNTWFMCNVNRRLHIPWLEVLFSLFLNSRKSCSALRKP